MADIVTAGFENQVPREKDTSIIAIKAVFGFVGGPTQIKGPKSVSLQYGQDDVLMSDLESHPCNTVTGTLTMLQQGHPPKDITATHTGTAIQVTRFIIELKPSPASFGKNDELEFEIRAVSF